jgi:ATP-dependent Lon protease
MQRNLATLFSKLLSYLPQAPREMEMEVNNISDPNLLTYFVASTMRLDTNDRQDILEERDTEKRLRKLTMLITKELEVVELGHKIQSDIQREMEKNQREFYLRQQLRAIQEELGETDPQQAETNELRKKVDDAKMPEDVKKAAGIFGHPHVSRLAHPVAVVQIDLGPNRHPASAPRARRGSLRSREDQRPDRRVSCRGQTQK